MQKCISDKIRIPNVLPYCNKVIAAGYTLAPKYANNFTADNNLSAEMIFPITADGQHTQTYGGMVYLIHAQIGGRRLLPSLVLAVDGADPDQKALVNNYRYQRSYR